MGEDKRAHFTIEGEAMGTVPNGEYEDGTWAVHGKSGSNLLRAGL